MKGRVDEHRLDEPICKAATEVAFMLFAAQV